MTHRTRAEQPLQQSRIGISALLGRMRPEPLGRDEGAFEVCAENPGRGAVLGKPVVPKRRILRMAVWTVID